MTAEQTAKESEFENTYCPYVIDPFPECYCNSMNSQNITKIVTYCSKEYTKCEIYKTIQRNHSNTQIQKAIKNISTEEKEIIQSE